MNASLKKIILFPFNMLYRISPKAALSLLYRLKCKSKLNWDNPGTYLEKLNWMKLYYRNELMPICADKYLAREYIEDRGFGEYLPRLLWSGFDPAEIPFDTLPQSFVIKSTTGSGNNIICKDKTELNKEKTVKKLKGWLKEKYLPCYGEWHYEKIKPRIIIEEYISDGKNFVPVDYKLFCFNGLDGGDVGCIAVDLGRYVDHRRNIYDADFKYLNYVSFNFKRDEEANIECPETYLEMRRIAHELAKPFPHVRVDFFVIGKRFYIGELTFFNGAGFDMITPHEYNVQMGEWIDLTQLL
ncbi:MAG: glycosyltransferase [Clostridia bacterium]|nr:glycosyltransferase [Clostridia bacterium]